MNHVYSIKWGVGTCDAFLPFALLRIAQVRQISLDMTT